MSSLWEAAFICPSSVPLLLPPCSLSWDCPEWATATGSLSSGFHLRLTPGEPQREFRGKKKGEIMACILLILHCMVTSAVRDPQLKAMALLKIISFPVSSKCSFYSTLCCPGMVTNFPLLVPGLCTTPGSSNTPLTPINKSSWNYSNLRVSSVPYPDAHRYIHWCWKWP